MDKCRLCAEINLNFICNEENSFNSETNDNKPIQILAKRLLIFEGYESHQNTNKPIWICDYCREHLQSFAKYLKVIKQGQEKWQPSEHEQQINAKEEELNKNQKSEVIDDKTLNIKATKPKNESCCDDFNSAEPLNDLPKKRLRLLPKRYQDNEILITKKPIKIISNIMQPTLTSSMALIPKIAALRLANGRIIGHLIEGNYEKSSKFRIICTICPSVFRFEKEYRKHLENHKDELKNNLEGSTQLNFNECMNEEKFLESFLYYCEICQKSFPEHFAVRRHYKQAHSHERTFSCSYCMAKFKYKFNLDYHMSKHMDNKNFECLYCKKKFFLRYELMLHQRTHTKDKLYKCQICSISFAHRSNFVKHLKSHTPKQTLKCSMKKNHTKSGKNLLQTPEKVLNSKTLQIATKNSYSLHDFEKYFNSTINTENMNNISPTMALPDFDSLQSNLQSSKLNTLKSTNSEKITILPKTIRIIKKPATNDYFDEMMLYNGELIKSQHEPGSFKIGNTTIQKLSKPSAEKMEDYLSSKQNNEKNVTTTISSNNNLSDFSCLKNYTNSSNVMNINSIDLENSSSYSQNQENSIISIENNINTNKLTQISNKTNSFVSSPKKSPLNKNLQNQKELENPLDSTANNTFYNLNHLNMANLNNSSKSTNLQNEENLKFSTEDLENTSLSANFINFNNSTNSPKMSPLLKFNENSHLINSNNQRDDNIKLKQFNASFAYTTTQSPVIKLPEINTKPFKFVKLSADYLKTKNVNNYNTNNSPLKLENSPFIKIIHLTDSTEKLTKTNCKNLNQMKKLKDFSNKTKLNDTENTTNIFESTLNLKNFTHDPLTIISYEDGVIQSESCLISPPIQITKEDILSTNITTENCNEILNIITDQSPPSSYKLPALRVLKSVNMLKTKDDHLSLETSKVQNYVKTDDNNSTPTPEFLNKQIFTQNLPGFWENSIKYPVINTLTKQETTNCGELLNIETYTNSPPTIENTTNSLLMKCNATQDLACTSTTKITESLLNNNTESSSTIPFKISKVFTNVELKSKPVKIYNLNNVNNLFTNSSLKKMPIKIITKSKHIHEINNLNDSNTLLTHVTKFTPHVTIRKTPLKLKVYSKHSIVKTDIKSSTNSDSLLIPKVSIEKANNPASHLKTLISTNSPMITKATLKQFENKSNPSKPLITKVEILPPLYVPQPVNASLNTASCSTQNLVKIPLDYKFQCNKCGKYFKQKSTLNKHLRTHTGDKPYKCNLCPKSYADASNYKKHRILHKNAANALNISPHLPAHPVHNSPTHSIASDPDPDGIEIMQTIKKFECSSSTEDYDDDVESLTSSTMESYMWEDALDQAIMNNEIHENIKRNFNNLNNVLIPLNIDEIKHNHSTNNLNLTSEDPD